MVAIIDISGNTFGKWTAIYRDKSTYRNRSSRWMCKCECGTIRSVSLTNLKNGKTNSCGCIKILRGEKQVEYCELKYTWVGMMQRCYNTKNKHFKDYGGRGIKVCEEWKIFKNFEKDMFPRPATKTLDRIDIDGDYTKENCRWATTFMQGANRQNSMMITAFGETLSAPEWEIRSGVQRLTISGRIRNGWHSEEAIATPPNSPRTRVLNRESDRNCLINILARLKVLVNK